MKSRGKRRNNFLEGSMAIEWLVIWGVAQGATFVFRPILEDLAKDVAKDAAKSYVGKCFKSVFSVIHRDPLTKANGWRSRNFSS